MTNVKRLGAWLAVATVVLAGPPALAQGSGAGAGKAGGPGQMFLFFDEDGDGTITRMEFTAAGAQRFADADKNNDGKITRDEWQSSHPGQGPRPEQQFSYLDANDNGVLDAEEFQLYAETRFETLDKNGDGALSQDELAQISRRRSGGGPG